ncbi:hypothetical protein [Commensalibacter oyaizuii]|uniref:Uncharacterized protein n=1 Tax=Commensalibacter oyaizuii TaxID=3043873 RepID=A0ABT6Q001_9PROT|nr:hypothetical protein [Commensalibacter sp. TBRC 16381]MDI2090436.1 hypothetical protein [Commensalibacter sp. TBRC 16381]
MLINIKRLKIYGLFCLCIATVIGDLDRAWCVPLTKTDNFDVTLPRACLTLSAQSVAFDLPLPITLLNRVDQERIHTILKGALVQTCTLQIQYDSIIQRIIALLLENQDVSKEQLKPYLNQLLSWVQEDTLNRIQTVDAVRKIIQPMTWQKVIDDYNLFITAQQTLWNHQEQIQQSYASLMNGDNTFKISPLSLYVPDQRGAINAKFMSLEQIMTNLVLSSNQQKNVYSILEKQRNQIHIAAKEQLKILQKLIPLLSKQKDASFPKNYKLIFGQLTHQDYLIQYYQIQSLSEIFNLLTLEQRAELKAKYMMIKGAQ